jgi:hypothetical protein
MRRLSRHGFADGFAADSRAGRTIATSAEHRESEWEVRR